MTSVLVIGADKTIARLEGIIAGFDEAARKTLVDISIDLEAVGKKRIQATDRIKHGRMIGAYKGNIRGFKLVMTSRVRRKGRVYFKFQDLGTRTIRPAFVTKTVTRAAPKIAARWVAKHFGDLVDKGG